MLGHMSSQDKIYFDIFQTLVEICTVALYFGSDTLDQTRICTGQHQKCLENVTCPTVISCSDIATYSFTFLLL